MSTMAQYAQIIWCEPTDEDVRARNKAVETIRTRISAMSSREAIGLAGAIAGAFADERLPTDLAVQVERAISEESAAFTLKGKELQASVCLAVAALVAVRRPPDGSQGWTAEDALAASLWSALTLQDQVEHPRREELRLHLIEASRERVRLVARAARKRRDVPDVGTLTISENDAGGSRANAAYRRATAPVIEALKTNQELDREEVEFLWWAIADHSDLLGCALGDLEPLVRAIAAGLEGATMLRRPPSDGFRHAVLRHVGASGSVRLPVLMDSLGEWRAKLAKPHSGGWVGDIPLVFPLISSLVAEGRMPATSVALDARGWGARALLEASIATMEDRATGAG